MYPFSFIKYSGNGQRNDITTICIVLNLLIFTPCNNLWEAQFKKPHHQEFKAQNLFDERPFPNLCYRFFEEVSLHCLYRLLYPPHLCSCSGCPGFHTNYPVHSTHQQCLNLVNSSLCSVQSWGSEGPLTSSTSYLYFL